MDDYVPLWSRMYSLHLKNVPSYSCKSLELLPGTHWAIIFGHASRFLTHGINIDTIATVAWVWQTQCPSECRQWCSAADVLCNIQSRQQIEEGPSVAVSVSVLSGVLTLSYRTLSNLFHLFLMLDLVLTRFIWVIYSHRIWILFKSQQKIFFLLL